MTRHERKLFTRSLLLGVAITLAVTAAEHQGWLLSLEHWLYDQRARRRQAFTPPPTDRLVHVDIDDLALERIGRWPWPRSRVAAIVDELRLAGARAIALDILLPEAEPPELVRDAVGNVTELDHDARLADAIAGAPRALVPLALPADPSLRLTEDERKQVGAFVAHLQTPLATEAPDVSARVMREAIWQRITTALDQGVTDRDAVRRRVLPGATERERSTLTQMFDKQYDRVQSFRVLSQYARPASPPLLTTLRGADALLPIHPLAAAADTTGFVDYAADSDGLVRAVPLWINRRGKVFPQLSLSLACAMWDVPLSEVKVEPDAVIIPRDTGGPVRIPTSNRRFPDLDQTASHVMSVPWFGPAERWTAMYDPQGESAAQHVAIGRVYEPVEIRQRLEANLARIDHALQLVYAMSYEPGRAAGLGEPTLNDLPNRIARIEAAAAEMAEIMPEDVPAELQALEDEIAALDQQLATETPGEQRKQRLAQRRAAVEAANFYEAMIALPALSSESQALAEQLDRSRRELTGMMQGKAVMVGWVATGAAADFVPTSLHARCPGVVVHGAIFSAIMTGDFWRTAPPWVTWATTLGLGLGVTLASSLLTPIRAAIAAVVVGVVYVLINSVVLFDAMNLLVNTAGPVVVLAAGYVGVTLTRFVVERRERQRIKNRFSSYVDPALVQYVLDHPEQASFTGEVREMTVVFTDLEGFTTLNEHLRERAIPLLNDYFDTMVPIIRARQGYVNKFLGDGIMFFLNAPLRHTNHAGDAVATVLEMQDALTPFNERLTNDGLPPIAMRAGVGSGMMTVGDAGGGQAADYTVLGDNVNLAARLEGANKATGTRVLINDRAGNLVRDQFLLMPVAKLQVVGRTSGAMTYSPIAAITEASAAQQRMVDDAARVVEAFGAARFADCLRALDDLAAAGGPTMMVALYRDLCEQYQSHAPDEFEGTIALENK